MLIFSSFHFNVNVGNSSHGVKGKHKLWSHTCLAYLGQQEDEVRILRLYKKAIYQGNRLYERAIVDYLDIDIVPAAVLGGHA